MQYFLITTVICTLDNYFKEKREKNRQKKEYMDGNVQITTSHNYGAFLNCGDKKPFLVKLVSILLSLGLTILFVLTFTKYGRKELRLGLAFLLGGAYSNTYDRIKRGYVIDYLNFPKLPGKLKNVVYNFSDFFILLGAYLITIKQL